ncbi:6-carboxy-5,6,7,8-tetrahydropterin synthase [Thermogymnomonas acidicola]|uniref:6-carboxy-5,6,7,8-tetrahydropterin synthase n=1 Tax=Thermogymnomonas acidicola TaxID=399579 RepID=A0AA37F8H5_9ARCH|nr:6-pyruvoyl tetrahydropterin synthase family protein [Thermogymnomonas acidicola]GGM65813.1 6-carboxy-5,6,7,8-tetrahydropterin synthase [Thermogymnomonas acidicola]
MSVSIEVNGWEANLRFSAAHFIPGLGKCSRLHGHDYAVSLRIEGETRESILMDFIPLKAAVREALEEVDHRILIPTRCPRADVRKEGTSIRVQWEGKSMTVPSSDAVLCDVTDTSSEELSGFILKKVMEKVKFPDNISRVSLCLYEGPGQGACREVALQ